MIATVNPLILITALFTIGSMLLVQGVVVSVLDAKKAADMEAARDGKSDEVTQLFESARSELESTIEPYLEESQKFRALIECGNPLNSLSIGLREAFDLPKTHIGAFDDEQRSPRYRIYAAMFDAAKGQLLCAGGGALLIFASTIWWLAIS